eukprot:ctg_1114.g462
MGWTGRLVYGAYHACGSPPVRGKKWRDPSVRRGYDVYLTDEACTSNAFLICYRAADISASPQSIGERNGGAADSNTDSSGRRMISDRQRHRRFRVRARQQGRRQVLSAFLVVRAPGSASEGISHRLVDLGAFKDTGTLYGNCARCYRPHCLCSGVPQNVQGARRPGGGGADRGLTGLRWTEGERLSTDCVLPFSRYRIDVLQQKPPTRKGVRAAPHRPAPRPPGQQAYPAGPKGKGAHAAGHGVGQYGRGAHLRRARLNAVASKVESGEKFRLATKEVAAVSTHLNRAVDSMDVAEISRRMSEFEGVMEDMDVRSGVLDETTQAVVATGAPREEVELLMQRVAEEYGLELGDALAPPGVLGEPQILRRKRTEDAQRREREEEERVRLEERFLKLSATGP